MSDEQERTGGAYREPAPVEVDEGDFVDLVRTHDAMRARSVLAWLEDAGVPASASGLHAGSVLPHLSLEIVVRVPATSLALARSLVDERTAGAELTPSDEPPTPQLSRPRRGVVFSATVAPGGGHFYSQAYAGGAAILGAYVLALIAVASSVPLALYVVPLVWLVDVVGGAYRWEAQLEAIGGPPATRRWRRFAPWIALALAPAWSMIVTPLTPWIAGPAVVRMCEAAARCDTSARDAATCIRETAARDPFPPPLVGDCARCTDALDDGDACREVRRCIATCSGR